MAEWLELRHLRMVLAVAEEGSFTRAAERLRVAQPSLSAAVARLERRLGGPLFVRGPRGASPTAAGAVLAEHARRLLADADEALIRTRAAALGDEGVLRVGVLSYAAPALVERTFTLFTRRAPGVRVERVAAILGLGHRLDDVAAGRLDIAFVRSPDPHPGVLAYRHVRTEPLLLAVAEDSPLAGHPQVAVEDLDGQPFAFYLEQDDPEWQAAVLETLAADGAHVRIVARGETAFDNLPLVAAGSAVTLVSVSLAALVTHAGVVYRPLTGQAPTIDLGVVWREPATPAIDVLLDVLEEVAGGEEGFALL